MSDGRGQANVTHPLPSHLGLNDLHSTFLADDPAMLHPLVFAAVAFVVLGGPKDLRTEEAILFGFEGPVVDRLRFLDLSVRPRFNLLRRRDGDPDRIEIERILAPFRK